MDYQGTTPDMESKFKHNAQVAAAYLSYIFTAGKWAARAGLRYEFTRMKASYPDGSNADYHLISMTGYHQQAYNTRLATVKH